MTSRDLLNLLATACNMDVDVWAIQVDELDNNIIVKVGKDKRFLVEVKEV